MCQKAASEPSEQDFKDCEEATQPLRLEVIPEIYDIIVHQCAENLVKTEAVEIYKACMEKYETYDWR